MEANQIFNAAQANKRVLEHHAKLTQESRQLAHERLAADKKKYNGVHVHPGTHKRPSQELMDQIQARNKADNERHKAERDKAFARSVQRLKDVKGGRRTRRHKKRSNKKRTNSRRSRRPNMRRIS